MAEKNTFRSRTRCRLGAAVLISLAGVAAATDYDPALSQEEQTRLGLTETRAEQVAKARLAARETRFDAAQLAALKLALGALDMDPELPPDELQNLRIHAVDWPDSSLGCPESGLAYLQVVTEGYLVAFVVDGRNREAHVGAGQAVACDTLAHMIERNRAVGAGLTKIYQDARTDLAKRIGVEPEAVKVLHMGSARWPDTGDLGCTADESGNTPASIEGYVIRLQCRDLDYEVRTDKDGSRFISSRTPQTCLETE
jgi:hypothetical protein